jgi:hypothetical protein
MRAESSVLLAIAPNDDGLLGSRLLLLVGRVGCDSNKQIKQAKPRKKGLQGLILAT